MDEYYVYNNKEQTACRSILVPVSNLLIICTYIQINFSRFDGIS
jgi:hypothetical protein